MLIKLIIAVNLVFTWKAGDNLADNFNLYMKDSSGYKVIATTANKETTVAVDVSFDGVTQRCFRVTAFNKAGESGFSSELCVKKPKNPTSVAAQFQ